ncbi:MAG TPA: PKD domain-containing protein [Candidatus Bathyarchaeia archaeon]|nr:PKD domain-containing protein [Candidatus Bathyarchaeia archaeon]
MRYKRATRFLLLLLITGLSGVFLANSTPRAHGAGSYSLSPVFPGYAQEGGTIALVLTVTGANATVYQFRFFVEDPATRIFHSILENYTNFSGQFQFSIIVVYPSTTFQGPSSLVGQYLTWVNQVSPTPKSSVASSSFYFILTDNIQYERTQTVNIQATGYNASETVTATIRPQSSSTNVFSTTLTASPSGLVTTSWKIPRNATIENYIVTLTGTTTVKNPPDIQAFSVIAATMTVSSLRSSKATYQRTETMQFYFEPVYPDGTNATTGTATLTLTRPDSVQITLTASYDSARKSFKATYKTTVDNETGTWTGSLNVNGFDDGNGNKGPSGSVTTSPQLIAATLTITTSYTNYVPIGGQLRLNASITYPDGSALQSGSVGAFLLYSGSPQVNDTVSIIFDSGLQLWVGSYSLQSSDPGGLWTLVVRASDSSTPPNSGSSSSAVTTQNHPPTASFNASPTSAPTGTIVNLDGTASYDPDGTVTTWSWNFGDGNSGLGSTTSHTYNTAGIYTITLTVTDNSGSTATATAQVTITDRPPIASFTPSPTTTSTGSSVSLDGTASIDPDGTIATWSWNFGDGSPAGLGSTTSHSYSTSGNYTITLTVADNTGLTGSTSVQITITDRPPSVSFLPSTTTPSSGQLVTVSITATDPDGSVTSITVDWGDGTVHPLSGTATSDGHTYSSTGLTSPKTYTIKVSATDDKGLTTNAATSTITVPAGSSGSSSGNGLISLPLYYFGILAAVIAALLIGGFLAFRRHKVTHARLKIDLEAVRSEAGRIENQEFFQSVKDQLKKDKDD